MKQNNSNNKRDLILNKKKDHKAYILSALVLIILSLSGYYVYTTHVIKTVSSDVKAITSTAKPDDSNAYDEVHFNVSDFNDGKARFFSYKLHDTEIKYFILKSSDGVIRAAFDACDVCWEAHKGYTQDGDSMVCNNCGRRFSSAMINVVTGGCNPSPLVIKISGSEAAVKFKDIAKGEKYFKTDNGVK